MGEALDMWLYLTQTQTVWACLPVEVGFSTLVPYTLRLKQLRLLRITSDAASGLSGGFRSHALSPAYPTAVTALL